MALKLLPTLKAIFPDLDDSYKQLVDEFVRDSKVNDSEYKPVLLALFKYIDEKQANVNIHLYVANAMRMMKPSAKVDHYTVDKLLGMNHKLLLSNLQKYNFYKKAYIALDTLNYNTINSDGSEMTWLITQNRNENAGYALFPSDIESIYQIKILDYYIYTNANSPMNKYSILIKELSGQSFVSNERKFHFWGTSVRCENKITAYAFNIVYERQIYVQFESKSQHPDRFEFNSRSRCSNNIDGKFEFDPPVKLQNTITLAFGNPYNPFDARDTRVLVCLEIMYLPFE